MDEETDTRRNIKVLLGIVVVLLIAFIIGSIYMPKFPSSTVHPPQVSITRHGDTISVVYLGGIDTAFVGDFKVEVNGVTKEYPKPEAYREVAVVPAPDITCVNVSALNLAVRTYVPIGYNCT
jgi:hypothetical protein